MSEHVYYKCDRCGKKIEDVYPKKLFVKTTRVRLYLWSAETNQREELQLCPACVDSFAKWRRAAHNRRDAAEADRIADELSEWGIVLKDSPGVTRWRRGPEARCGCDSGQCTCAHDGPCCRLLRREGEK